MQCLCPTPLTPLSFVFSLRGPVKRSELSQPGMRHRFTKPHEVSLCLQTSLGTSPRHRNANPPWQFWKHLERTTPDHPYISLPQNAPEQRRQRVISVASCGKCVTTQYTKYGHGQIISLLTLSHHRSPSFKALVSSVIFRHPLYCPRGLVAPILVDVHIAGVWKVVLMCEPST